MRRSSLRIFSICFATIVSIAANTGESFACGIELCPDDGIGVQSAGCFHCGQPKSTGSGPVAADALTILKAAVGQSVPECSGFFFCLCDVNGDGVLNTTDALLAIKKAVGQAIKLGCQCPVPSCGPPCTSAEFFTRAGAELDYGWTGIAHDTDLVRGPSMTVGILRRCTGSGAECEHDEDCTGWGTCEQTCNCNEDPTCEITGPTQQRKCRSTLADCSTNADCDAGVPCVHTFGPPLPLSSGGTPLCVVDVFDGPITGTVNSATGDAQLSTSLKSRVFLGIAIDKPCPRCGAPGDNPEIGNEFTCSGGQRNGLACTVDGVTASFGGTSYDCAPSQDSLISGTGLAIRLGQLTTGTTSKQAKLPCKFFGFTGNPTVQGSNPKCLDTGESCTSNADCRRCTEDAATVCTSNGDCAEKGFCGEAPDQPVTCGYWCSCGFCSIDKTTPCFDDYDCPQGQECKPGTGSSTQPNMPQQRPNDCSNDDKFVCGGESTEECAKTEIATCSGAKYRQCETDQDCENFNAGFCNFEPKPCFESRITRTGSPSPLGTYCAFEEKACTTNADCTQNGDFCAPDSMRPETVALFCMPATQQSGVNSSSGISGPAALRLKSFVQICRCGDGRVGCDEDCDDGNLANADGCDDRCQFEPAP